MQIPTSPDKGILNRALPVEVSGVLGRMAGVIERMVDFGTHLVIWAGPNSAGTTGDFAPPLMLTHHTIEAADAISVLLRRGCIDPCGPLLRSEMEGAISMLYILKEDTERRGRGYRYARLRDEELFLARLDPSCPKGLEMMRKLSSDKTTGGFLPKIDPNEIASQRARVSKLISDPKYSEIHAEWERIGKQRKRPPAWHALFGGPSNIACLAEAVGCAGLYEIFYRHFSDEVHSTSAMKSIRGNRNTKRAELRPFRYPSEATSCFSLCGSMLNRVYIATVERFCPEHLPLLQSWYIESIRSDFMELSEVVMRPR